jgi:hypothetical protein
MPKPHTDKKRAKLMDLIEQSGDRLDRLRDHAMVPGNTWLAKGELRNVSQILSDLEQLLDEIKEADAENGY